MRRMADPTPTAPPADAAGRPYPPRLRWLKVGAAGVALLALSLLALRLVAGWSADRRVEAAVARLRAEGRPVVPADLNSTPPPDAENAAVFLARAAASIKLTKVQEAAADKIGGPAFTPADLAQLRAAVAANAAALADAHAARDVPKVDWRVHFRRPVFAVGQPNLNPQRELANLMRDALTVQAADGDSAAAVGTALDLLRAAKAEIAGKTVVANLVGLGMSDVAVRQVELALPKLTFAGDPGPRPASRAQAAALVDAFLDYSLIRGMADAVDAERVGTSDFLDGLGTGWTLRPFFRSTEADRFPYAEAVRAAAFVGNLKAAESLPAWSASLDGPKGFATVLDSDQTKLLTTTLRAVANRRLAAVAVAVRLYRVDHAGRLPGALADLVPQYLPAVPVDPMRADGGPLGYAPTYAPPYGGPASPRVYSVGRDGADDGGAGDATKRWKSHPTPNTDEPFLLAPPPGGSPEAPSPRRSPL